MILDDGGIFFAFLSLCCLAGVGVTINQIFKGFQDHNGGWVLIQLLLCLWFIVFSSTFALMYWTHPHAKTYPSIQGETPHSKLPPIGYPQETSTLPNLQD